MTLTEYLQNPYGKGAAFASSPAQKQKLEEQYTQLEPKIHSKTYLYRNTVIYHVLVPSHKADGQTYDVIIEIKLPNANDLLHVNESPFKAFSNCPSFIFTYAHAFYRKDMLCSWLNDKFSIDIRKNPANSTNSYGVIGYERSLYLAIRYLKTAGKTQMPAIKLEANKPHNYSEIARTIRSQKDIMDNVKSRVTTKEPPKTLPAAKIAGNIRKDQRVKGNFLDRTPTTASTSKTTKGRRTGRINKVNKI